jgi:hypothetical protein
MRVGVLNTVDTSRHRDDGALVRGLLGRAGVRAPLVSALVAAAAALALVVALLTGRLDRGTPAGGWQWGDLHLSLVRPGASALPLAVVALLVLGAGLSARARHDGPLDWLVPAALRAAEYLLVAAVGLVGAVPAPVVYLLLFVLALRHYDLTARMEKGAPAGGGGAARLGWDGRVVFLTAAALLMVATLGEAVLAGIVGGGFLISAIGDWRAGGTQ